MAVRILSRRRHNIQEQLDWCNESFGPGVEITNEYLSDRYRWCFQKIGFGVITVYFNRDEDLSFYLLMWG